MSGFQPAQPDDASNLVRGLLNTVMQTIKGIKTFLDMAYFSSGISMDGSEISTGAGPITGNPFFPDGLQVYEQAYMGGGINMDGSPIYMGYGGINDPLFVENSYGATSKIDSGGNYRILSMESVDEADPTYSQGPTVAYTPTGSKMSIDLALFNNPNGFSQPVGVLEILNDLNDWDETVFAWTASTVMTKTGGQKLTVFISHENHVTYGFPVLRIEIRDPSGALAAPLESGRLCVAKVA